MAQSPVLIEQAIRQHQAGNLVEAARLYNIILQTTPDEPDANHNLGILLLQQEQGESALPFFYRAIEANPQKHQFWISAVQALCALSKRQDAAELTALGRQNGLDASTLQVLQTHINSIGGAPPAEEINRIVALFSQGRLQDAETSIRRLVTEFPHHPFGWKALGALHVQQGDNISARAAFETAIALSPFEADVYNNLGSVLAQLNLHAAAVESYQEALALQPDYAEACSNMGNSLKALARFGEAEAAYRQAVALRADYADAWYNLAILQQEHLAQPHAAIQSYQQATRIRPDFCQAWYNLASAWRDTGNSTETINAYRQATQCNPQDADAHYNLAITLEHAQALQAAVESYQRAIACRPDFVGAYGNLAAVYHRLGDAQSALEAYQRALELKPDHAEHHNNLGILLHDMDRHEDALACYRQALLLKPNYAEAINNMGNTLHVMGRVQEAEKHYRRSAELDKKLPEPLNNLANVMRDMCRLDEAVAACQQALAIKPDYEDAMNNLLFCVNYHPEKSGEEIYRYYEEYETRYGAPLRSAWQAHGNAREASKRLKAGYVSPSFHHHSVRHFLEPLLSHHDKAEVEIYAYAEVSGEDAVTERYRAYADHWINTRGMSDAQLAERIRADRIDILIDVAGHTGHNRLLVFARKPAPVSLHWLDFGYTTGLKAIDYYLGDPVMTPEGSENVFSEQLWRLPATSYAYRPDPGMGEVTALPAQTNGHITFGTLTRSVRINDRVIRAWSEILKRVPGAKLNINSGNFKDTAMQAWLAERFTAHGIERERLEIGFQSPAWTVLQQTDISLDCFPHNSGTTLFESLYMGVPYITLASRPSVGTLGASLLAAIGHSEWTAQSEEDYVEKAVQLAQNLPRLAELRANLRGEMQQSPLMDEVGFARAVEQAYRAMWAKWCGLV